MNAARGARAAFPRPTRRDNIAPLKRVNLNTDELERSSSREGYRWRGTRVGDSIGAERIGGSVYDLDDGQLTFPYNFHHGVEEWLYVIDGSPVLRTPQGEQVLTKGDFACFQQGPAGAHSVRGPGRVLILSANQVPSIAEYPDSDKVGTRPADPSDRLNFLRSDAVDYWEGE